MPKERKRYDDDDGRTIAKMNVDGMPWYASGKSRASGQDENGQAEISGGEKISFVWGVLKAALLVTAIFAAGYLLFILFCTNIWFN